jgi:hypothetical protein
MMILHPSSLSPVASFDEEEGVMIAKTSPLMNPTVIKHLITVLN